MNDRDYWRVVEPISWPAPPRRWSLSAIAEFEACPRRWALRRASYKDPIGRPYPARPTVGQLRGQAIHGALEEIMTVLQANNASSGVDVVKTLKSLGGYSTILATAIERVLNSLPETPRIIRIRERIAEQLHRQIPYMRQTVQFMLQRVFRDAAVMHPDDHRGGGRTAPLPPGFHSEVRLEPSGLAWIGIADAIRLHDGHCEIIDYKSGDNSAAHQEQLHLYALLWARDAVLNPRGVLADRLTLVYSTAICDVAAPDLVALSDIQSTFEGRALAAFTSADDVPVAHVTPDNCRFCEVKQLCSDYWTDKGQAAIREEREPSVRSVEVAIVERRTPTVVVGTVRLDPYIDAGTPIVISHSPTLQVEPGDDVRFVSVRIGSNEEGSPTAQEVGYSESYIVTS